jgi:hypothetical protein
VVELCDRAGLAWGKELHFDATQVRANAALASLVPRLRPVVDDHLEELFTPEEAGAAASNAPNPSAPACRAVSSALEQ